MQGGSAMLALTLIPSPAFSREREASRGANYARF